MVAATVVAAAAAAVAAAVGVRKRQWGSDMASLKCIYLQYLS